MRSTASMRCIRTRSMATARTMRTTSPTGTGGYHPHESPLTILVPIVPAGARRSARGPAIPRHFRRSRSARPTFWRGTVAFSRELAEAAESSALWVKLTPTIAMLIGLWIAWNNYIRAPGAADRFVATFPAVYRFVSNKWYFDELYDFLFVRPSLWLGRLFWHGGDEGTIDRFGPHGAAVPSPPATASPTGFSPAISIPTRW